MRKTLVCTSKNSQKQYPMSVFLAIASQLDRTNTREVVSIPTFDHSGSSKGKLKEKSRGLSRVFFSPKTCYSIVHAYYYLETMDLRVEKKVP